MDVPRSDGVIGKKYECWIAKYLLEDLNKLPWPAVIYKETGDLFKDIAETFQRPKTNAAIPYVA